MNENLHSNVHLNENSDGIISNENKRTYNLNMVRYSLKLVIIQSTLNSDCLMNK